MSSSILFNNNKDRKVFESSTTSQSIIFRAMIFFQIIAYGSYSILVHLCEQNGTITFSSVNMNFLIEFLKLIFSLNAFIFPNKSIEIEFNSSYD